MHPSHNGVKAFLKSCYIFYTSTISQLIRYPSTTQCGGLSMRCHRVTVYQDIKI